MESSIIELKVISCKDLKAFNFFQKLSVYALVSIVSDDNKKLDEKLQQQRTPTDREGDGNPEWNHTTQLEVSKALLQDCDNIFVHFDLRHEGVMFGDKTIGEVRVPLKDLIQDSNGAVRFVIYEVRTTDGKSNGVLNFSFQVNGKGVQPDSPASQIAGYPIIDHSPETQVSSSESPGVHYPLLELENTFQVPQQSSSAYGNQNPIPSQENYFWPQNAYYQHPPPPPPPPPLMVPPPPPPPPLAHGPYYHHPPPPAGPSPWDPAPYVGAHGSQMGRMETWPNGWQGVGNLHSTSWNGR